MAKQIFPEVADLEQRKQMLIDNCDEVVEMSYHKSFTSEELLKQKDSLAEVSVDIENLELKLQEIKDDYKEELKPLREARQKLIEALREKGRVVTEKVYKMVDDEAKVAEFYNGEGELIQSRPATREELSPTIFSIARKAE